jgi:hypothetical protein
MAAARQGLPVRLDRAPHRARCGGRDDPTGQARLLAFAQELAQSGWINGRNVRIDLRWGATDPERIRSYAAELVALAPDVIFATGSAAVASLLQQLVPCRSFSRRSPNRSAAVGLRRINAAERSITLRSANGGNDRWGHIAAQSQCGGMFAAGESGLWIVVATCAAGSAHSRVGRHARF